MSTHRRALLCLALLAPALVAAVADARIAVVAPLDDGGIPRPYPGRLPERTEQVPLSWDYAAELAPMLVVGARLDDRCDRAAPSIADAVDEALARMTELDADGAVRTLDRAIGALPCLQRPAEPRALAELLYYRGAALAFLGDEQASRRAMRRAVAVDPFVPADGNLPGPINDALIEAKHTRSPTVPVRLRVPGDVEVRIDGRPDARELSVDGLGLLQWRRGERWSGGLLELRDATVVIGTADELRERLRHADDPLVPQLAAALGERLRGPLRIDAVLLWDGDDGALLWDADGDATYELDAAGDLRRLGGLPDLDGGPDLAAPDDPRGGAGASDGAVDDRLRVTAAGGLAYLHPFPYATVGGDVTIALYRRLWLALGGGAAFRVPAYQGKGALPMAQLGLRVRLGPRGGPIDPWIGAGARAAFEAQWLGGVDVGVGGAVEVGLDVCPVPHLVIRAGVEGGFLRQAGHVHAKIALGFGI